MTTDSVYDFFEHHGIKGMRWGSRKSSDSGSSAKPKKLSRHDKRQAKFAANQQKAQNILASSLKEPTSLVLLNGRQVITGKEFVQHMSNGGLMDVRTTRVYARQQTKNGPYVLEPKG